MRFLLALSLFSLSLVLGADALACSCKAPPPPKKALEGAEAVCFVEVVKIVEQGRNITVTLKVERWWKGGEAEELIVSTSKFGEACGYGFEKGGKYLVYAHPGGKDKPLHVSLCSRTRTEQEAEKSGDFKELGEGKAPAK